MNIRVTTASTSQSTSKSSSPLSTTDAKSNFGAKGWGLVLFCMAMLYISAATTTDGLNVTVAGLAELHGWSTATLLSFSTISGLISIAGMFLFGFICHKKGARLTCFLALVLGGLSYIWYGNCTTVMQYAISLILVNVFGSVHAWIGGGAYLAAWFPKKKGIALGWTTMGNNIASATIVILLTGLSTALGLPMAISVIGIATIILGFIGLLIPNHPEQAGYTPDNVKMTTQELEEYRKVDNSYVSPWTFSKILKTKEFWKISLGCGLYMLVTVGIMSQMISRLTSLNMSTPLAITAMSICAIIGIAGSYMWGVLDQKLSTRVAAGLFGIWFAIAILLNLIPTTITLYISIAMIGCAIGGNANWPISLTSTVFGYRNFTKVFTLVNPAFSIVRVMAFTVLAVALALTGSLSGAYIVFFVLALLGSVMIFLVNDKKWADGSTTPD